MIPSTNQPEAQEYASSESDVDDSLRSETQNLNDNAVTQEQADKQDSSDSDAASDDDDDKNTRISSRQKRTPAAFKVRPENPNAQRKANLLKRFNSDKEYSTTAIQSLTSPPPNTFQDTALSMERSPNII